MSSIAHMLEKVSLIIVDEHLLMPLVMYHLSVHCALPINTLCVIQSTCRFAL